MVAWAPQLQKVKDCTSCLTLPIWTCPRRYHLTTDILAGPLDNLSFPSLQCSPSLGCRGCIVDISFGDGHPTVCCSLHFDQL